MTLHPFPRAHTTMRTVLFSILFFGLMCSWRFIQPLPVKAAAEKAEVRPSILSDTVQSAKRKDTCRVGMYLTSLYDLNFSENSFSAVYWLWFTYANDDCEPLKSFEVLNTKQVTTLADTRLVRTDGPINYATAKMRITAKKEWEL
ncbi:MAG: hypothetical protein EAZ92_10705, partial [Candidatus Kapaibacterium sp.]